MLAFVAAEARLYLKLPCRKIDNGRLNSGRTTVGTASVAVCHGLVDGVGIICLAVTLSVSSVSSLQRQINYE